jgi:CHAD domain-containing protein
MFAAFGERRLAKTACLVVAIEPKMPLDVNEIEKPFKKLRKLLKKFPRQPSPSEVHDVRTRARRVEAALRALLLDGKRSGKRTIQAVTPIRKRAGKVRDMDVLTGFASTLANGSDNECLVELLEHLGQKRFDGARKLHRTVVRSRGSASQLLKRCSSLIWRRFQGKEGQVDWPMDAAATALQLSAKLGKWPKLTADNLHAYRLKVKELRNVLQLSGKDDEMAEKLGEVKDAIGEWHDWTELAGIAGEVLDHGQRCEVREQIRAETKRRFDKALVLATRVRRQYFEKPRAKKKRGQTEAVNEKLLKATAKLAA